MNRNQTYLTISFVTILTICAVLLTCVIITSDNAHYNEHDRYLEKLRFDRIDVYLNATNNRK